MGKIEINKPTVGQNCNTFTSRLDLRTGLGSRFGSWLLERGLTPKFAHLGTHKEGCGGLWEQYPHQGLDPDSIMNKVKALVK